MAANRGKQLEEKFEEALKKLYTEKWLDYIRLYDITMGYSGVKNPCDFVAFKKPIQFYIECKATNENTLNLTRITQYDDLVEHNNPFGGTKAGVIVWFTEHKETYWVDIEYIKNLKMLNYKSINIKNLRALTIPNNLVFKLDGENKRVFTEYDLRSFFEYYTQNS